MKWYKAIAWGSWISGLAGLIFLHDYAVLPGISEALFIAGFLALVVDPYLKRHLGQEIIKDAFAHILAPDLPIEVRERIQQIARETKLYRRNLTVNVEVATYGRQARVELAHRFELFNASREPQEFKQLLTIDDYEDGSVQALSLVVEGGEGSYDLRRPSPSEKRQGYTVYEGPRVSILPSNAGVRYIFAASWVCTRDANDAWISHMAVPTLGVKVETKAPENFEITAPFSSNGLIMTAEHIDVFWKRVVEY